MPIIYACKLTKSSFILFKYTIGSLRVRALECDYKCSQIELVLYFALYQVTFNFSNTEFVDIKIFQFPCPKRFVRKVHVIWYCSHCKEEQYNFMDFKVTYFSNQSHHEMQTNIFHCCNLLIGRRNEWQDLAH